MLRFHAPGFHTASRLLHLPQNCLARHASSTGRALLASCMFLMEMLSMMQLQVQACILAVSTEHDMYTLAVKPGDAPVYYKNTRSDAESWGQLAESVSEKLEVPFI